MGQGEAKVGTNSDAAASSCRSAAKFEAFDKGSVGVTTSSWVDNAWSRWLITSWRTESDASASTSTMHLFENIS